MNNAAIYDYLANRLLELGEGRTIEKLFADAEDAGYPDAWDLDRHGLHNAMKVRGFVVSGGSILFPVDHDGDTFNPVATDYATFVERAKIAIDTAGRPVDTAELIERCDLVSAATPGARMRKVMADAGYHYIRGAGYWIAPQYTTPGGQVVSSRIKSRRVAAMLDAFETHGWPLAGQELPELTKRLVTSSYASRYALKPGARIASIGSGLYIPADLVDEKPFAMSRNIIEAIKALQPGDLLDDSDNLRLFRIGLVMSKLHMADVKMSRSIRAGKRVQTMRIKLTTKGERIISHKSATAQDAF